MGMERGEMVMRVMEYDGDVWGGMADEGDKRDEAGRSKMERGWCYMSRVVMSWGRAVAGSSGPE